MPEDAATIAKDITLAILPSALGRAEPAKFAEEAAKVFTAVLMEVKQAMAEAQKGRM